MKNILILLVLFLGACSSNAQTTDYLFKGIPIEGSVSKFSQKLQTQGFVQMTEYQGMRLDQIGFDRITHDMLSGMFMNQRVVVALGGDQDSHEIQGVQVEFPKKDEALYIKIQQSLAENYSDPKKWSIRESGDAYNHSYKIFSTKNSGTPYIQLEMNPMNLILIYNNPARFNNVNSDL
jgi:lipoprotein